MLRIPAVILGPLALALLTLMRAQAGPAAGQPTPANSAAESAELQAALDALPRSLWVPSADVRTSVGWRDNLLLSAFAPIARPFGRAEIDAMLLRPMRHAWEFVAFVNADVLRYFSPPDESGGEQQWSFHAETRWQPLPPVRLALKATGYLRDMVIDLSETEAARVVAPTRVRGGVVAAVTRLTLPAGFSFEPMAQLRRTDYRDYPGDYDEPRLGARIEWSRSDKLAVSAAWFEAHRRYRERAGYTASGRELPGTRLRFRVCDAELKLRTGWHAAGAWELAASAGRMENRDEASGYFNYDQKRARLELGWHRAAWRVDFDAETKHLVFLVQTVGAGLTPPARRADDHDATLRLQRELTGGWAVFLEHHWERSRSNLVEFSYRANTVLAGVQRSY